MIRVLVVDDSPSVRQLLAHILDSDPDIEIAGCAQDGEEALRMAQEQLPDVITMDLHMPNVDGFEATRSIMQTCPAPIVIVSGSANPGEVDASFRAIEAGALVIVQRPFGPGHAKYEETARALVRTVKSMAEVKVVKRWPRQGAADTANAAPAGKAQCKLVVIGASTGGPAVLREILGELPAGYALPIVIVQHMASGFMSGFSEWLSSSAGFAVGIAANGDYLRGGRAWLVPDGFQAAITNDLRISLAPAPAEHGMCPSVSHLFRSIHKNLMPSTVGVLLTGMGKDGALELRKLKESGAITIVQDRATSVVYGMPGEAIRQDAAKFILNPAEIGKMLRTLGQNPHPDISSLV